LTTLIMERENIISKNPAAYAGFEPFFQVRR
jgi:hypothetical protein